MARVRNAGPGILAYGLQSNGLELRETARSSKPPIPVARLIS